MNSGNYFKDLFGSLSDYRKIILLMFLNQNDNNLLCEIGFSQRDINRLNFEFKNILIEEHGEYLDFIENEEESVIEKFFNR